MTRAKRTLVSRMIASTIAVAAFCAILLIESTIFQATFGSPPAVVYMAMLFSAISFLVSWIINMIWKSNRDSTINGMGYMELHILKAVIEQQIELRNDGTVVEEMKQYAKVTGQVGK